ncbi:amino acid/polyamine/organocation transporter (APC superfamily) [Mucilaginibacter gracilis]|uniref:Arginine/agmatine antiporter n=1 Tax=Mucilaginibacter gracilis TaxID=423350 RepID=A0A495JBF3_9SPHI|nr:amino acid permease [Mucilaginibacter gracilis]RKR85692.1 amino acid/polyamine/organocation transporter (APC superfamily) [Mucilaginibacter gracilis]
MSAKKLGIWSSTSLVVGNMIGAGVFLMPAALASFGSVSLLGWVFSAIGSFFLAKVFGNLSALLPQSTGGPYAYTRHGLGNFAGFLVAWGYWIAVACANAAITISFVGALSTFFPVLASSALAAVITGLCSIWFLTWLNTRGITASGNMQVITTVLKLLPLFVIAIGGLFFIRIQNFHPFNTSGGSVFGAITATASITMFSFVGIECATIPAASVNNPGKTIGRATMLGLLIATLVYILGSVSIMGIIPATVLQHSVTPYADAAVIMFGSNARYYTSAGVAIAAFGALNGWTLIQGQVPFAIAKDKLFPPIFGKLNKKGVPYAGMLISSSMVSLFMTMNYSRGLVEQFKFLLLLSTLSVLIPYLFSAAAYVIIRCRQKQLHQGSLVSAIALGAGAFTYSLWAIAGAGQSAVYWGFILLMAGIPLYVWIVNSRKGDKEGNSNDLNNG